MMKITHSTGRMGNNKKLPIQKFSKKVKVDRKERGLPLPIQFRAETFEWVMVMVDRKGRPKAHNLLRQTILIGN